MITKIVKSFFDGLFTETSQPVPQPTPQSLPLQTQPPQTISAVVIDGQNVMYGSSNDQRASLLNVLGLTIELNQRRIAFKCFFDANTFHTLMSVGKKSEAYAYRRLCYDFPDQFIEVPGHNRADDFLLDYAHSSGDPIISNDQYRDFATQYGWVTNSGRRASFLIHSGMMQIVGLGIRARIPLYLTGAESAVRNQIGIITGKYVPINYQPSRMPRTYASPLLVPAAA
jgi:hypothetical protein